jgi:hypothetical protein
VDQPHVGRHVLDLAALEHTDEVPLEQIAVLCLLAEQLLRAVLAHQPDAGLGEGGQVLRPDVLDCRADLDPLGIAAGPGDPLADAVDVAADPVRIQPSTSLNGV